MANSVWLVTTGSYSSYRVLGVFSTRPTAKAFVEKYKEYDSDVRIEKLALDPAPPTFYSGITVRMVKDGTYSHRVIDRTPYPYFGFNGYQRSKTELVYTVDTDNLDVAVKAVNEIRAMLLANEAWGNTTKTAKLLKGVKIENPIE